MRWGGSNSIKAYEPEDLEMLYLEPEATDQVKELAKANRRLAIFQAAAADHGKTDDQRAVSANLARSTVVEIAHRKVAIAYKASSESQQPRTPDVPASQRPQTPLPTLASFSSHLTPSPALPDESNPAISASSEEQPNSPPLSGKQLPDLWTQAQTLAAL